MTGAERLIEAGRQRGLQEGRQEGEREVVLRQLRRRFGSLPPELVARAEAASTEVLERWAERLVTAGSLDEVFAP